MALFNIGQLIGSFARPKTSQVLYSDELNKALNATTSGLPDYRAAQEADLGRLTTELGRATENLRGLEAGDQSILTQLLGQQQDPLATYREIGNYQTGVLDSLAKNLAGMGRSQDSALMARFGMGGRGNSTYQNISTIDRLSKNLAPYYAQSLGNLGRDTGIVSDARTGNVSNVMDILNSRASVPMRTVGIQTLPSQQRSQNLQTEISSLLGLGEGYRGNSAGFKQENNKWADAFSAIDDSLNSAVDIGMSAYSGGATGGLGGILGGVMGGSSGGQSRNTGSFFPTTGYGMNRNGGNNQAILQLLSQLLSQ